MPRSRRSRPGPMPERSSSCAEPIEPADRMTSPFARAVLLAPSCRQRHAGRAPAVELDALGEASGLDPQVRPVHHGFQKSARRRPAPPAPLVDMEIAGALVVAAIEIVDRLDAVFLGRLAERIEQRPLHARRLDAPFAADAVVLALAEEVVGLLPEERQHVAPAPAGEAELAPVIVVGGLPAHVDHGVDRRRAAEHLAARIVERASVQPRFGLGLEHPVGARVADREQVADRDVEPDPVVVPAGFEQQHAVLRVGGQAIGKHAARRTRADDDVIVFALDRRGGLHSLVLFRSH